MALFADRIVWSKQNNWRNNYCEKEVNSDMN